MLEAHGTREHARYRTGSSETEPARRALELLLELEQLTDSVAFGDPLRDALHVSARALECALRASPILEIAVPESWHEQTHLWHGPDALRNADASETLLRKKLDALYASAFDRPVGPTCERREVVASVVAAGRELADYLRDPKYASALASVREMKSITGEAQEIPFVATVAEAVELAYSTRYRKRLHFQLLVNALIASAQDGLRNSRAGTLPKGAPNHLSTMADLLASAGIAKPTMQALRDDYREARDACRPKRRKETFASPPEI